jgi:lipopolysaccharide export system protein LptA
MMGGVKYGSDDPLRQAQGEATEGRAAFDKKGHPEHVTMTGAVHLQERVRVSDAAGSSWNERELHAGAIELALATDSAGKTLLQDAKATGDARLKVTGVDAKGGATNSALAGDVLTARFVRVGNADHISEVHGDGHTSLRRVNGKGAVNTASGDSLVAHFHLAGARGKGGLGAGQQAKKATLGGGADEVSDATEVGHVVVTQLPVRKPGDATAPTEERTTAERAVYDGQLERTTLTGNVQVSDGTSVLWADRVVTEQQTGDATADGSVKASYGQAGSTDEPVHVQAARAELNHDSQIAIFHGAGKPARLWQGASQVDAPVLQFERKQRRLLAHGEGQGAPMAVHTVLVGARSSSVAGKAEPPKPRDAAGKAAGGGGKTDVVRVLSRDMVYSDTARTAEFTGGVTVESKDGNLQARQVVAYLQPAQGKVGKATVVGGTGFASGKVERVVATGNVEMEGPGRRATGEQVVYTASDGMFVLTGTPTVLPKVTDDQKGTVTGTLLRFHSDDDDVVVSNGGESGAGHRVRTETRVKNKQ